MKVFEQLAHVTDRDKPYVITIGNFDGVHLGHKAVLRQVCETARALKGASVVLTFSNHPSEVLRGAPFPYLCTLAHRLNLLEATGIDKVLLLRFTREFSLQPPEQFLFELRQRVPFSTLILGHDAAFGHNRRGDQALIQQWAKEHRCNVIYVDPFIHQGVAVSSSVIRQSIQKGDIVAAGAFLGRPYSILGMVTTGRGDGKKLGFPTANLAVRGLCLPPFGVYTVYLIMNNYRYPAIANLGIAPMIRSSSEPILEVHLLEAHLDLYGKEVEVEFGEFVRPERLFDSIENLKAQIALDIQQAQAWHKCHE